MDGTSGLNNYGDPAEWLAHVQALEKQDTCPAHLVTATLYVAVRAGDNRVVGMIDLRHRFSRNRAHNLGVLGTERPALKPMRHPPRRGRHNRDRFAKERLAAGAVFSAIVIKENRTRLRRPQCPQIHRLVLTVILAGLEIRCRSVL